jgi:hypothetical protein
MDEEIRQAIESVKEQQPIQVNLDWYQDTIKLPEIKEFIRANINSASRSFVAIGYYLKYVKDKQLFSEEGYESIWEFAKTEFGIGKSSASQFMSINDKFSKDGNSPILLEQYRDFSSSKLAEMLNMTEEQLEQITPATTIVEIRQIKKPEKEEVVLTSEQESIKEYKPCKFGCGKCNLFTDPNTCSSKKRCISNFIEDLKSEPAPEPKSSGKCIHRSEFPCTLPEASKIAQGDGEQCSAKCCWNCPKHGGCGYECNSSAHRPVVSKFSIEEIVRYSVPDISIHEELKMLCAYNLPGNTYKVMQLMLEQDSSGNFAGKWTFSEGGFTYTPSDTRQTKTISWDEYCDAFRKDNKYSIEYYISNNDIPEIVNDEPEIVDIESEIANDVDKTDTSERYCSNCNYDTMDPDEYFADHPGTKEFPCNNCNDKLSNWEPNKEIPELIKDPDLSCKFDPDARCLIASKESCKRSSDDGCMSCSGRWGEEDYITVEPEHEPVAVETVEADIIQTVPEEVKQGTNYSLNAVYTILQKAKSDYEEIIKVGGAPEALAEKRLIIRDALLDYYQELRGRDTAWYINPQPELTIFKNNDQRKEWAENYKAWGEWYYDEHIDCHYYKYDFQNGDRLVVDEYRDREYFWSDKKKDEQHYHLLQMKKPAYGGTKTFEQKYMHQTSSMTEIVEYLKELQKKGA